MPEWIPLVIILLSGGVGGMINAILSDNGFIRPREEKVDNVCIIRPGFMGNVLLGAVAAFISWGLYGAFSGAVIYGAATELGAEEISVSISAMAGAILVGMGGARWLTNEVDKSLLKTAVIAAAASKPSQIDSQRIVLATPAQAFNIAKKMYMDK